MLLFFPTPRLCQDLLAAPLSFIWISGRFKRESFPWQMCVGSGIGPVKYTQRDKKKRLFLIMNARVFLSHDFWCCLGQRFNSGRGKKGQGEAKYVDPPISNWHLWISQSSILRLHLLWRLQGFNHFRLWMVTPNPSFGAHFSTGRGNSHLIRALTLCLAIRCWSRSPRTPRRAPNLNKTTLKQIWVS